LSEEQNNFNIGDLVKVSSHNYRIKNELAVITHVSKGIGGLWDTYTIYLIKKNENERCYKNEMTLINKYEKEY